MIREATACRRVGTYEKGTRYVVTSSALRFDSSAPPLERETQRVASRDAAFGSPSPCRIVGGDPCARNAWLGRDCPRGIAAGGARSPANRVFQLYWGSDSADRQ